MNTTSNSMSPNMNDHAAPAPMGKAPGWGQRSLPRLPPTTSEPKRIRRSLTEREKEILRLVCDGLSNAEIALRLGIARETVKSELKRIFRKIEVKNRTQAAVLLVRRGLF